MNLRSPLLGGFALLTASLSSFAQTRPSENTPSSDESAVQLDKVVIQSVAAPTANTLADRKHIELQSPSASVMNAIKYLPGVNLSQGDALGGDDWSTRITIRGFNEAQLGFTLDNIPTGFTGYAGGAKPNRFIDTENLASILVSQGAGDISSASSQALGGTLSYLTANPQKNPSGLANYTFGSFSTSRAFLRADTGSFAQGTSAAFVSFSAEQNDNWVSSFVGGSSAVNKRIHLDGKDVTQLGNAKVTVFATVDNVNPEINYQGVSLQQFAQDPRNDRLTFNWTGNPDIDQNYAQTWTTIRTNSLVYAKIEIPVAESVKLTVQPYWHHQNGKGQFLPPYQVRRYDAAGNLSSTGDYRAPGKPTTIMFADAAGHDLAPIDPATGVAAADPSTISTYTWLTPAQQAAAHRISSARFSRYRNNRYGDNTQVSWQITEQNTLLLGMWNEDQERARHRTWHNVLDPKVSSAYEAGAYLDQFLWKYRTLTNMLYVQDKYTLDKLTLTGGLKYFDVHLRDRESSILPSGDPGYSVKLKSNSSLLPSVGARYQLDPKSEVFLSYTENFSAVPDGLLEAGASGVDLSKVKPEKSENIDAGYRYSGENWALSATVFYIKYKDKLVQLSGLAAKDYTNASSGVWTNIGGTEAYGTELAATYRIAPGFSLLGTFSYTHSEYTADTPDGTIVKGKRVVDTPSVITSAGILYEHQGVSVSLLGKNTGKRYGTYSNDNSAPAYTVFDFNAGYTRKFSHEEFIKSLTVALSVTNITDKNYLSNVSINDQGYVKNDPTGTTMLWNIGAPRTYLFTVALGF